MGNIIQNILELLYFVIIFILMEVIIFWEINDSNARS